MPAKEERRATADGSPLPGALSALLGEIARAPDDAEGSGWATGLRPGAVIAERFELTREVGRGGFGVVYEARDLQLGRKVAFKAVRAGGKAALREERLQREAEAAARLSHPNIVVLHDLGRCEHGPFLVLELLQGQTLGDRLAQGPLARAEAMRVAGEVAEALAHAHGQGVVHRDLTPGNVFLCEDGRVKVLDFGLAHAFGRRRSAGGTPAYMAPEQWRGAPEDERTDVFALGVLLFRMLAGSLPFPDDDQGRAVTGPAPAPALSIPDAPAVAALVARMLAKDPVERPRDGAEVRDALATFARELARTPSSDSAPVVALPPRRRWRPALALALGLAAAAALIALAWGLREGGGTRSPVAVAVADFANQTGEPELDGLSGMLITSLEQSRRLSVLTRVRMLDVLRQLGKANVAVVDEPLGREVARSAGVRALVLATIRRFDQLYAIELKVLDPVKSEYLFTLQEQGTGKASVPGMIDKLSAQTRRRLRESPAEVAASQVKVAEATTRSIEAYQHYFRGDQLKDSIRYEAAIAEYRQAIALDPSFALPHWRIAYLGEFVRMEAAERKEHMEAALRTVDRVPAKERLLLQAWQAHMEKRDDDAHALYARLADAYPQDKEVLFLAGDLYLHEQRWAEGLPYFERAVELAPDWEPALMHRADSLAALGRKAELRSLADGWVARSRSASAYRAVALAASLEERPEEAAEASRRAVELDGTPHSRFYLAEALTQAGRHAEAEELARAMSAPGASPLERSVGVPVLASSLAYQGRLREALATLERAGETEAMASKLRSLRAEILLLDERHRDEVRRELTAMAGSPEQAKRAALAIALVLVGEEPLAAEVAARQPGSPEARLYQAGLAWKHGDAAGALRMLRQLRDDGSNLDHRAPVLWLLAHVATGEGNDLEVVSAADALRTARGGPWLAMAYPEAVLLKAEALARLGKRGQALAAIDGLLAGWQKADPDLPLLLRARAIRRKLA